jgi:hypothetical protein
MKISGIVNNIFRENMRSHILEAKTSWKNENNQRI